MDSMPPPAPRPPLPRKVGGTLSRAGLLPLKAVREDELDEEETEQTPCTTAESTQRLQTENDAGVSAASIRDSYNCDQPWKRYFDGEVELTFPSSSSDFSTTETSASGFALHTDVGTGSQQTHDRFRVYLAQPSLSTPSISADASGGRESNGSKPLIVLIHGGGHTAMSWAIVASLLKQHAFVLAYDQRGHGASQSLDEDDLSAKRLVQDGINIITKVTANVAKFFPLASGYCDDKSQPTCSTPCANHPYCSEAGISGVVLVGHSMGGAIACGIAATGQIEDLLGLALVDVVEGTAIEALPRMRLFVDRLPKEFCSRQEAVRWAITSKILQNKESAILSIPSQLTKGADPPTWKWRCDLTRTEPFWKGWFEGLSSAFLSIKCPKILVLSGHDILDKTLMIAHMQGKFQLQVVRQSGHVIMEDQPLEVSTVLLDFMRRYKIVTDGAVHTTDVARLGSWNTQNN